MYQILRREAFSDTTFLWEVHAPDVARSAEPGHFVMLRLHEGSERTAMVWLVATLIGFAKHGLGYLKLFVTEGVPLWLMPVIIPIELISYFIRPISHSLRLFANMMAGHTMLKVFAGFAVSLPVWGKIAPVGFMVAFTGLEFLVAFLQALIFTVLTCIYLNDAVNMHH